MKQILNAEVVREASMLEHMKEFPLPAYPGVINLIESGLNDPFFRLAIATSSSRTKSKEVLTSAGVPYDKMAYVTGSDVANKKPDPELFLTAAKQINITPGKCLVIEDAPSGIEAAINAGCKCIAVTNSFKADKLQRADRIVDTLEEISISDVVSLIED